MLSVNWLTVITVILNLYKHADPLCSFPSFCRIPDAFWE